LQQHNCPGQAALEADLIATVRGINGLPQRTVQQIAYPGAVAQIRNYDTR
jgi:hypothetical protein